MPKKTIAVTTTMRDSYEIDARVRDHLFKVDQPKPVGGNVAPNPVEYFMTALGGCICTITRTIAEQRKIDLKGVEVSIEGKLDTDFLLGLTTEGRAGFYEIVARTKIDAPLTLAEKEALLAEVEARCPVSENILNKTNISLIVEG